jgi:urease accessory protein
MGWNAHLSLKFGSSDGKTVLCDQRHSGPLLVQRPFYPEGESVCHVYVLHPPGGVVGGDTLELDIGVRSQAHVLATTPTAGKFYRSAGPEARQTVNIAVQPGAALEWLPQETIIYDQVHARISTRIDLAADARFIGWDVLCLGLPASGAKFQRGMLRQTVEIWRDGELLLIERGQYDGESPILTARWGLAEYPVNGTFWCTTDNRHLVEVIRQQIPPPQTDELWSATWMQGLLVCRYLGWDAFRAHRLFVQIWQVIRPDVFGREACPPRIWRT